jgi:hypothetical protein
VAVNILSANFLVIVLFARGLGSFLGVDDDVPNTSPPEPERDGQGNTVQPVVVVDERRRSVAEVLGRLS